MLFFKIVAHCSLIMPDYGIDMRPDTGMLRPINYLLVKETLVMTYPFHLALHVTNLDTTRSFYRDVLGCTEGRSTDTWIDFDFFGHQLSLHLGTPFLKSKKGIVDGAKVSMPHFGAILPMETWQVLAQQLEAADVVFEYGPKIRFEGEPGEQATMFFRDPSGNPLEIKGFKNLDGVFAK